MTAPAPRSDPARRKARGIAAFLRRARPPAALAHDPAGLARLADPARVRSILLVKPHDQLGDLLVAAPAMDALRARYPAARIVLVTRPYLEPLARRLPAVDEVWVVPRPGQAVRFVHFVQNVRRLRPELAFVLNSVSRSGTADAIAALSGATLVVGRSRVGAGEAVLAPGDVEGSVAARDAIYDLDLPFGRDSAHQAARLIDLVRWTGAAPAGPARLALGVREREAGEAALGAAIARAVPGAPRPWVGFHPAAANPAKCWPVESFLELAARVAAGGATPVVFDTPKDPGPSRALLDGLARRGVPAGGWPAGPLGDLLAPLAALDLLACNDSGVLHVAAALGVPTLSFHSLGRPEEWAPQSETAIALHAERIAEIPVAEAGRAAARLLDQRNSTKGRLVPPAAPVTRTR